ncbi:8842_t:CDS:2 [Funneliformis geosporum]|uniref:8842_t:CDS:1 n=1 Tax=Funneliformis geosporum TaxID=1117311 RepID=A0A9W4SHK0_9GLOM|nr:8842_t:CDS:2 [Funneliformis geosporum]
MANKVINNIFTNKSYVLNHYRRIEWVPYSAITSLEKIAEGGFGIVYRAVLNQEEVAIKRFYSKNIHSGNLLLNDDMYLNCHIGDLGLSQPADVSSQNNEIYGVIPYIAPEDKFDNLYDPCFFLKCNNEHEIIKRCEEKRLELIQSMKLGPEFSEKPHPKAIYTSRALSSMTFKTSSTSTSSLTISSITNQEYFSREFDFDINNIHNMQNIKNFRTDNV